MNTAPKSDIASFLSALLARPLGSGFAAFAEALQARLSCEQLTIYGVTSAEPRVLHAMAGSPTQGDLSPIGEDLLALSLIHI